MEIICSIVRIIKETEKEKDKKEGHQRDPKKGRTIEYKFHAVLLSNYIIIGEQYMCVHM